jgi:RNA polymerase sigma-70 factor (ECF subfamily)
MDTRQDTDIVAKVLQGEKDAFAGLVNKYQRQIYNLMLRATLSQEEAADLTQETFIKAYEKLESFNQDRKFFTWLYTLGLNHLRDHCRRVRPEPMDDKELERIMGQDDHRSDQAEPWEAVVDLRDLDRAVRKLPLEYREAVMLRYRDQLELSEVAEVLGVGLSAAKMRIHRGLAKLRAIMRVET